MKTKLFSLFVALFATTALWAYHFQSGDLYYNITSSSDKTVEVTCQERYSFNNYKGLTSATIPTTVTCNGTTYSVTSIGEGAFEYCTGLTSITIGNSVTSIGESAFRGCEGLTSVIWNAVNCKIESGDPGNLYSPFAQMRWHIDTINMSMYSELYSNIESFTFGREVKNIPDHLCAGLSALTSIFIPNGITNIGNDVFWNCSGLTSIAVESDNMVYDSRNNCNSLIQTATNTLIRGQGNRIKIIHN